jgi:hypothetical protein
MSDPVKFMSFISKIQDERIILLRIPEVVQWLFGDHSFLPDIDKKNKTVDQTKYKVLEDNWGQATMKMRRPDLKLDKQWTNRFGEYIAEEIYWLKGKQVTKPAKKEGMQPDIELDDAIVEVKTGTFYTSGTASEKIMGTAFKYADIPELYGKPLRILCLGGAEKLCREQYGNLPGPKCSTNKQKMLDVLRQEFGVEFVGASDILKSLAVVSPTDNL